MKRGKDGFYCKYVKRVLDFFCALILAIPASLVVSICYVSIKAETNGPAFFVQERPGKNGKIFKMYKMRTMVVETARNGKELCDVERITKTGEIIRRFSLDELPQLFNIIKGEMSFIGPRPLLVQYLPLYTKKQMRRHEVLPGISGWAQVNGRNELSWEDKFSRDIWYVDNVCFPVDLKIFFKTIWNVMHHCGINSGIGETMEVFKGSLTANDSVE